MKALLYLLAILVLAIPALGAYEMTLLAVQESDDGYIGSPATITLELQEGKGRVLLETRPLTRTDTQFSTRFAKQYACSFTGVDCSNLDFVYTISSTAPIVGGPSAGAAMSILTIAALSKETLDGSVAITGTINSGGIVGPVGSIKQKIDAAKMAGVKTVIIPLGESSFTEENTTIDLIEYGTSQGIAVYEAGLVDDVVNVFYGEDYKEPLSPNITINEEYEATMNLVAKKLCQRSDQLLHLLPDDENVSRADELLELAKEELANGKTYSAASRCFSANIQLSNAANELMDDEELLTKLDSLQSKINIFKRVIGAWEINSMARLQTSMIVNERITESQNLLDEVRKDENENNSVYLYSYANERLYSAISWSEFGNITGVEIDLTADLEESCTIKLEEATERIQYASSSLPIQIDGIMENLDEARDLQKEGNFIQCLYQASLAKARADTLIGTIGVGTEEQLHTLVDSKIRVAQRNIAKESQRNIFPIAGYAYAEYAQSLLNESPGNAILFSQYALELSNFDLYFTENAQSYNESKKNNFSTEGFELLFIYIIGILTGIVITYVVLTRKE